MKKITNMKQAINNAIQAMRSINYFDINHMYSFHMPLD